MSDVTALILVGGLGTRLRSVVADRPKVLAEINGRPFLTYLLDQIAATEIKRVILCTGHLGEQVKKVFGNQYRELQIAYSQESSPLGTAGALRLALPLIQSGLVLIMNGDSFCQTNLKDFQTWHNRQQAMGSLVLTQVPNTNRYGQVRIDAKGKILSFMEKGKVKGPGWINAGIYLLNRELLQTIPIDQEVSIEKKMFPAWMPQGIYGYQSKGDFLDIGTPESYAQAEKFFTNLPIL